MRMKQQAKLQMKRALFSIVLALLPYSDTDEFAERPNKVT